MDSIKSILSEIKSSSAETKGSVDNQGKLFDMDELESNPKKLLGDKYKYISKEYQVYGLNLARKLDDKSRATMYIKWAKEKPRAILERAMSFTSDYPNAKDKSRIFMWKVKEIEKEYKLKRERK